MSETYHIPALAAETIKGLNIHPDGVYADATFGGGGHSRLILSELGEKGRLYGFDRDKDARANAIDDPRFTFVHGDFRYIENFMRFYGHDKIDGILADLGVSFHHFDAADRGFSFRFDAPLDMRMNREAPSTAADILAEADQKSLTSMLKAFTDLRRPDRVAAAILNARDNHPIQSTFALAQAAEPALNPKSLKKDLAQVFQAFRIEVNGEMDALRRFLSSAASLLRPGGRLAVITYHSIEDRMVKNFLKCGNFEGERQTDFYGHNLSPWIFPGKPVTAPTEEEIELNPRARSAKLRVAELAAAHER